MKDTTKEIIHSDALPQVILQKKDNQLFIGSTITDGLFNQQELTTGYMYNIGYDKITLDLEEDEASITLQKLNDFDKSVYDAICSIDNNLRAKLLKLRVEKMKKMENEGYSKEAIASAITAPEYTFPVFNSRQVYQMITGEQKRGSNPCESSIKSIEESIEKLRKMNIDIVYKDINNKGLKNESSAHLLQLSRLRNHMMVSDEDGNQVMEKVTYYRIESIPILYQYALFKEALSILPSGIIKSKSIRNTKFNVIIKSHILNAILDQQLTGNHSTVLTCSEYYELLDVSANAQKTRIRDTMTRILDDWIETGFIDSWEVCEVSQTKRQTPLSYMVHMPNDYTYASLISSYNNMIEQQKK